MLLSGGREETAAAATTIGASNGRTVLGQGSFPIDANHFTIVLVFMLIAPLLPTQIIANGTTITPAATARQPKARGKNRWRLGDG